MMKNFGVTLVFLDRVRSLWISAISYDLPPIFTFYFLLSPWL